ncbi:amino acid transporter AVT6C-like [Typha angustifolia]|uniref:amino acid transporter AVT6C-like n=1 Tax=Typha angustifolia TaxID=59011 RepID=UPI003C2B7F53
MKPAGKGESTAAFAPLLPKSSGRGEDDEFGGASVSSAVFNVSTSIVGAGIMSIPAAMRVLGVGPALILITAVAFLADVSAEFLMRYTGWSCSAPPHTYATVMGDAFGVAGSAGLQGCVAVTTAGTLVVYLIIIGDVMCGSGEAHVGVLQEWFDRAWWNEREVALLLIVVLVLLPLALPKRVDSLRYTSAVSILLAVVFMCISLGMSLYALLQGTATTPRLLPDFSRLSSAFELFTAVPVIVVAFTFHFNVHSIRAELSKTSDMKVAVRVSLILCSIIYSAVGFFGYLLFGDSTMADILSNFDQNSGSRVSQLLNDAVRLSYVLHLVLVFPLLHFSLRINVDGLFFPKWRPLSSDNVRFVLLTGVLMGLLYVAAIAIPNIWTLFQFFGSTTAVCLSLIFPGAIVLRDVQGIAKRRDKALAATMIILAVITSSIAIASNVVSSFGGKVGASRVAH